MTEKLVFDQAVDGLFLRGHGPRLTPAFKAELRTLGIDLDKKLLPAYPLAKINAATEIMRRHLYAHIADDHSAYRAMGEAVLDGYFDTVLGRAMANVLRVIGFRKAIERMPRNLASGNNYQQVSLNWLAPNQVEMAVAEAMPHPALNLGVFDRAFTHWFKAPGFHVSVARAHAPGATYLMKWTA
jgi:uncharacterized protein (TIGR02265 family)